MSTTEQPTYAEGVQSVPLAAVWSREGWNPRTSRDADKFAQTVASVAKAGVLQPVLVTPERPEDAADDDPRALRVVAGEGRYLAAKKAGLDTLPVSVRHADAKTGGLEWAIAENVAREDMDPIDLARAWQKLRDARWAVKKIAAEFGVSQKLVTERLRLLQLPETIHGNIADGTVPLSAVKALAELAAAHQALPAVLVARVLAAAQDEDLSIAAAWRDVLRDPAYYLVDGAETPGCALPDDVFPVSRWGRLPVERLDLSDETVAAIAEIERVASWLYPKALDDEAVDQAAALGCLYRPAGDRGASLVIGRDVASQVLTDSVGRKLAEAREREAARTGAAIPEGVTAEQHAEAVAQERREQRQQAQEDKRKAVAYNEQLGAEVARHLARVDPKDTKVIQLIAAIDLDSDVGTIAARGARYAMPGWVQTQTTGKGTTREVYLTPTEAADRARDYLAAATSPAEVTGRILSLVALAHYADERAVAQSSRAWWTLPHRPTPWGTHAIDLLHAICGKVLPEHITANRHQARADEREATERYEREMQEARDRLAAAIERAADLTADEREQARADVEKVHGRWTIEAQDLHKLFAEPAADEAPADETEPSEPVDEDEVPDEAPDAVSVAA